MIGFGMSVDVVLRENRMVDSCVRKNSSRCDPSNITRVRPHVSVNHMHGFLFMLWFY